MTLLNDLQLYVIKLIKFTTCLMALRVIPTKFGTLLIA